CEEVAQQRFGTVGDGVVETDVNLLARKHRQPAAELSEIVAAGQGPVEREVLAPLPFVSRGNVSLMPGEVGLAEPAVMPGMRPADGSGGCRPARSSRSWAAR